MPDREVERQRALAVARARRRREEEGPSFLERVGNLAGGINRGLANVLGAPADLGNYVVNRARGREPHERPVLGSRHLQDMMRSARQIGEGYESEGLEGRVGEFVGSAAVPYMGVTGGLAAKATSGALGSVASGALPRGAQVIPRAASGVSPELTAAGAARSIPGAARGVADDVARSAVARPVATTAAETAGAGAAGAASYAADQSNLSPLQRLGAETAAGVAGAFVPTAAVNATNRVARWGAMNLLPFTGYGAEMRAASQMQRRAADPDAAATRARNAPEGVSPARATEDPSLMAQERYILDENPALDAAYRENLLEAARRAREEMRDMFGTPQGKQEWEQTVIESVSAPGTVITPGFTDDMLDQAYKSFDSMYEPLRSIPFHVRLMHTTRSTPLRTMIMNAPKSRSIMASDNAREQATRWLENKWSTLSRYIGEDGIVPGERLLKLRSDLRTEARRLGRARDNSEASAIAEILGKAEEKIDDVIKSQLSPADAKALRDADRQYARFKVVENAARAGGEKGITPDTLSRAVRSSLPGGEYSRGAGRELRGAAAIGTPIKRVLQDPEAAAKVVRHATPEQRRAKHAELVHELMQRARTTTDGGEGIDAMKLRAEITRNADTARALGMDDEQINRLRTLADQIVMIQRPLPGAVSRLMDDGPSSFMELGAIIIGTEQGARISSRTGANMGGAIAIANYMSGRARAMLNSLTGDKAMQMIIEAHSDPEKYAALLTKSTDPLWKQQQAARVLEAWLLPASSEAAESLEDLRLEYMALGEE